MTLLADSDLDHDRRLVERCQGGDAEAFTELYQRYRQRLFRYCVGRLGDAHEAEDVTQESFARAWKALHRFGDDRRFYPWLRVIAANACTDILRTRGRSTPVEEVDTQPVDGGQERIIDLVDQQTVRLALGRLPDRHRQALYLREELGWSYDRIATHDGVSVGTVESLLWRARQALKKEFAALSAERLAGVPVVGWGVRRISSLRRRAAPAWQAFGPQLGSHVADAFGAAVLGTVLAAPFSFAAPPAATAPPSAYGFAPVSSAAPAPAPATAPGPAGNGGAASAEPMSGADGTAPASAAEGPTSVGPGAAWVPDYSAGRQAATQQPVNASLPGAAVGFDPASVGAQVAGDAGSYLHQLGTITSGPSPAASNRRLP